VTWETHCSKEMCFDKYTLLAALKKIYESIAGRYEHPLFCAPAFSPKLIRFCSMHCVNLGILQNFNGSIVALLIERRHLVGY